MQNQQNKLSLHFTKDLIRIFFLSYGSLAFSNLIILDPIFCNKNLGSFNGLCEYYFLVGIYSQFSKIALNNLDTNCDECLQMYKPIIATNLLVIIRNYVWFRVKTRILVPCHIVICAILERVWILWHFHSLLSSNPITTHTFLLLSWKFKENSLGKLTLQQSN